MPTYEYRCKQCAAELEVVQAFTDDTLTTCEVCGGDLRKVFGNVGISFKGSGFYKTDSRNGSSKSTASSSTEPTSTESKPEKAPDKTPEKTPEKKADKQADKAPAASSS